MADSGLLVTISGAALSLLFYENACSPGDQMGFLLGDVLMYVTKNVTDSERHEETVRKHIEITGVLTCPSSGALHDSSGKIYKETLKDCVRERSKEIVGWFKFRHNNRLVPTFRDKILHKELAAYFHECNSNASKELFLACILNASTNEKQGTHKFRHVLIRYDNGAYLPVPLRINNLGGGVPRQDTSDYMPAPARIHKQEADVFTKFVRSLKLDLDHKSGRDLVMTIQKASEKHLDSLVSKLCESDREVYALERQVQDIRMSILKKVLSPKRVDEDDENQEAHEAHDADHRVPRHVEGERSVKMDTWPESPPRMQGLYEDGNRDSSDVKVKTLGKPHNTRRNPSNSVQRPQSEHIPYSQDARKSVDPNAEIFSSVSDCS